MLNLLIKKLFSEVYLHILKITRLVLKVPFANPTDRLFKSSTCKCVSMLISSNNSYSLLSILTCTQINPVKKVYYYYLQVSDEKTETLTDLLTCLSAAMTFQEG